MRLDTKYGGRCKCSISKWSEICQYHCVYMIPYINWKYTYKRQINGFKDCGLLAFVCRWSLKLQICILLNIVQSGHRWPAIWVDLISFCVLQVIHLSILHFISILSFAYWIAAFLLWKPQKSIQTPIANVNIIPVNCFKVPPSSLFITFNKNCACPRVTYWSMNSEWTMYGENADENLSFTGTTAPRSQDDYWLHHFKTSHQQPIYY